MNDQLKNAIQERINLGWTKEQIVQQLVDAGYSYGESSQFYTIIVEENKRINNTTDSAVGKNISDSDQDRWNVVENTIANNPPEHNQSVSSVKNPPLENQVSNNQYVQAGSQFQSNYSDAILLSDSSSKSYIGLIIGGISVFFIAGMVITTFVMGWHRPLLSVVGLGGSPYNEVTLLPGLLLEAYGIDRSQIESNFSLTLEKPDTAVLAGEDDFFEGLQILLLFSGLGLPEEAHLKINTEAIVDNRIEDDVEFDIKTEFDMLFEPVTMRAGGSMRRTSNTLYARVDRLPAMFLAAYESQGIDIPVGEWIILPSTQEDIQDFFSPGFPNQSVPAPRVTPLQSVGVPQHFSNHLENILVRGVSDQFWNSITALSEEVVTDAASSQSLSVAASLGQVVLDSLPESTSQEEREVVEESLQILARSWRQYPLIKFAQTPYRTTDNGESVYVYELLPATENFEPFFKQVLKRANASSLTTGVIDVNEIEEFLSDQLDEVITLLHDIEPFYDLRIHVRPDGSLQGVFLDAAIRSELESFPYQFRLQFHTRYTAEAEIDEIQVPTEVHEKTFMEILSQSTQQRMSEVQESIVRLDLSVFRSTAELYYNQNRSSYQGLCESDEYRSMSELLTGRYGALLECTARQSKYAVMANVSSERYICVTSEGRFDTIENLDSQRAWQDCSGQTIQS